MPELSAAAFEDLTDMSTTKSNLSLLAAVVDGCLPFILVLCLAVSLAFSSAAIALEPIGLEYEVAVACTDGELIGDGESRKLCFESEQDFCELLLPTMVAVVVVAVVVVVLCSAASLLDMLSCFFHFVRRFWNHILTCSDREKKMISLPICTDEN